MKRRIVLVRVLDYSGDEMHNETRSAFNAGIRASEDYVRSLARKRGEMYVGAHPRRDETGYHRMWTGEHTGHTVIAHVSQETP